MAVYEVNGAQFELPDEVQGEQLKRALRRLAQETGVDTPSEPPVGTPGGNDRDAYLSSLETSRGLPKGTLRGILMTESGGRPGQVSNKGAKGYFQFTDATAQAYGLKDPHNFNEAARAAADYMRDNIKRYGSLDLALVDYNGGPKAVAAYKAGKPFKESAGYLQKVQSHMKSEKPTYVRFGQVRKDADPHKLYQDKSWLEASKTIYRMHEGKDWKGSNKDLAEWGLDFMGWFNYNLPRMGYEAAAVSKAKQSEKEAFLHLMDQYDNTKVSWGGVGRFFKGVLTDPTTYVGLSTLGVGLVGKEGAKQATKAGLRELLKRGLRTGAVGATEGAIMGATDSTLRQSVEVSAGRKEGISTKETLRAAGIGAGVGLAGGTLIGTVAESIAAKQVARQAARVPAKAPVVTKPVQAPKGEPFIGTEPLPSKLPEVITETPPTGKAVDAPQVSRMDDPLVEPRENLPAVRQGEQELIPASKNLGTNAKAVEGDVIFARTTKHLDMPDLENKIPFIPRNMQEVTQFARDLGDDLRDLHYTQAEDVVEELKNLKMTQNSWASFNRSTQIAVDTIRGELRDVITKSQTTQNSDELRQLVARQQELEDLLAPVALMDESLSSLTGSALRQRQEGLTALRGASPKKIMEEEGLSKEAADAEYVRRYDAARESQTVKDTEKAYDQQISTALAKGDVAEATRLTIAKEDELTILAGKEAQGDVGFIRKLNEAAISNVFSATTVQMNVLPSMAKVLYRPLTKAMLNNPFETATRRELLATYGGMRSAVGGAFKAAVAAFRYEQAILTRESARLFEGELAIKGIKGAMIRIFPRLLNASDEFMSRLAYEGFISGRTAAIAYETGVKQGLKGKELDNFIKARTKEAVKGAYADSDLESKIRVVKNKAVTLGYKGEALQRYVMEEVQKNQDVLKHGHDAEGLSFVREVLYKTAFDAEKERTPATNAFWRAMDTYEDGAGWLGARYEEVVNKQPIWRLMGQLFFRTPVRVFEEGMRLTPGVQVLTPGFINDLYGRNGRLAQVRAQGESLMSMAFAGLVLSLYAQGKVAGDGAYSNYKQQRNRTDSDMPEPYTIRFDDGSTWSFRNFDPIATPLKIIINGMERWEALEVRRAQGELEDQSAMERAFAAISVGTAAIAQSIRDANLMAGLDAALKFGEYMANPEENEGGLIKFMGEKLRMLVPNTLHKIAKSNDPTIDDPVTWWQMVESRVLFGASLGEYDKTVPKSYDVLGNPRRINDTGALWGIFSTASEEERRKGLSETELDVMRKLDYVSKQTGAVFTAPAKHPWLGDVDLKQTLTSDGKETLYDRWMRYYKESEPEIGLSIVLDAGLPVGTESIDGSVVSAIREQINAGRDMAFTRLMAEETGVSERVFQNIDRQVEVKTGMWDQMQ